MAQGYFEIRFKKEDGSNDDEMGYKVIEWCKKQYDWFNQGIDDEQINTDGVFESINNNGIVESEVPDEALEEDWIREIYEEFNPYDMKAVQILGDGEYSEGSYSFRKWYTFHGKESNCLKCYASAWDWVEEAAVEAESGPNGPLLEQSETLGKYYAKFKNKKNGKTSRVYITTSYDELIVSWNSYLLDENDERISCLGCFDHFDDEILRPIEDGCADWENTEDDKNLENWEFESFCTDDFWNEGKI